MTFDLIVIRRLSSRVNIDLPPLRHVRRDILACLRGP